MPTATSRHISPPSWTSLPLSHSSRSSQSTKLSQLCCRAGSHQLSISHIEVRIWDFHGGSVVQNQSANGGDTDGFNPGVRKIPWRRNQQPTPVFLPRKSHRQRSLVGYSPWGHRVGLNLTTKHVCIYVHPKLSALTTLLSLAVSTCPFSTSKSLFLPWK